MNRDSIQYKRQCAVSKAWKNEYQKVIDSKGSRNWSPKEQREILSTGKCHGYEGQHMLSVKAHPEHAGNPNNIQFLTHKEHFKAHGGNWKNDANGRYNLKTGKVERFSDGKPSVKYKKLSDPISERSKTIAQNKYRANTSPQTVSVHNKKLPVNKKTNGNSDSLGLKRAQFNKQLAIKDKKNAVPTSEKSGIKKANHKVNGIKRQ